MSKNVGGLDRLLRLIVGVVLVALAFLGVIGVWGYVGVIALFTALVGWCPLYIPLGLKTCGCAHSSSED